MGVDDPAGPEDTITLSLVGPSDVVEGETTTDYTLTLTEPVPFGGSVEVTLAYSGVALDGTDFVGETTVTIAGTLDSATFDLSTIDDALAEGTESFTVAIDSIADSVPSFENIVVDAVNNSVETTITDQVGSDDPAGPEDTVIVGLTGPASVTEGDTTTSYTITLSEEVPADNSVTVIFAYSGAADDGTDFTGVASIDVTAGNDFATFTLDSIDDALAEGVESFVIEIDTIIDNDDSFEATVEDPDNNSVTTTIIDASELGDLTYDLSGDATVAENGTANYSITIGGSEILNGESVTIDIATIDGAVVVATEGVDYNSADQTLTISGPLSAGDTVDFTVTAIDDAIVEGDENYTVQISNASTGTIGVNEVDTVITDVSNLGDLTYDLSGDATVAENGTANYSITIGGSEILNGESVTIDIATIDGAVVVATEGVDYNSEDQTLTISGPLSAGDTVGFTVTAIDDAIIEGDENYSVTISNPSNGAVGTDQVDTVITDVSDLDALTYDLSGDATVAENGTANYLITIGGSEILAGEDVTIDIATIDGAVVVATEGVDYNSEDQTLTISGPLSAGDTVGFTVTAIDDAIIEGDENYSVTISNPSNGAVGTDQVDTVITDVSDLDALTYDLSGDATVAENGTANYLITIGGSEILAGEDVTIDIATIDGAVVVATEGVDYNSEDQTLTISGPLSAGDTVGFTVTAIDDAIIEGDENYSVTISNPSNGAVGTDQVDTVITDVSDLDALTYDLSGDATVAENGTANYLITIGGSEILAGEDVTIDIATIDGAVVVATVTIDIATIDGAVVVATEGVDYNSEDQTLTISGPLSAGDTVGFTVTAIDDAIIEGDENYSVTISNPSNGAVGTDQVDTVITDVSDLDALTYDLSGDATVAENGTANYLITIGGSEILAGEDVTIDIATIDGAVVVATEGVDYNSEDQTLTISGPLSAGDTVGFTVTAIDDAIIEGDENYSVTISNPSNGAVGTDQVDTVITDVSDLDALTYDLSGDATVAENGTANYLITIGGSEILAGEDVTIDIATIDGAVVVATEGVDYNSEDQTLTISGPMSAGDTVGFTVTAIDDAIIEGDENYSVTISNPSNGAVGTDQVDTVITDVSDLDALTYDLSGDATVAENGTANYLITIGGSEILAGEDVTIDIATIDGAVVVATEGVDYNSEDQTLTISGPLSAGDTVGFTVTAIDDAIIEGDENYSVTISNPSNGAVGTDQVDTVITDVSDLDALTYDLSGDATVAENGTANYLITIGGSEILAGEDVTIDIATIDGAVVVATRRC